MKPDILIGDRTYKLNPQVDRYQIPIDELKDMKMSDIPKNSHVEITAMEMPDKTYEYELYGLNSGIDVCVYGGISAWVNKNSASKIIDRMQIAFPNEYHLGDIKNPQFSLTEEEEGKLKAHTFLSIDYTKKPETLLRDAIIPFVAGFRKLKQPIVQAFICHSSDDKPVAREIAGRLHSQGAGVWFDEWEIRVGESIVAKINEALGRVTHLVVLLSKNSVEKPWVTRELSSSLMRQLSEQSIVILPVVLDDCKIPPLLADIKYANFNSGIEKVVFDLEAALFQGTKAECKREPHV